MTLHRTIRILAFLSLALSASAGAHEIGLQLYSLRHQMAQDMPSALATVRDWGIEVVEGRTPDGYSPQSFKSELDRYGLSLVSIGTSFEELRDNPMAVVEEARVFGAHLAMLAWIPHDDRQGFTLVDANAGIAVLNHAGKVLAEHGITLQYHPHGYEFGAYEGGTLLDHMLRSVTDARFQMDVFWIKQGGGDPVALLQQYPGRFLSLHLKDRLPGTPDSSDGRADDDTNVVLGAGDVGISEVVAEARRQGLGYFFIEDESSRVLEQVPLSIGYLHSLEQAGSN